MVGFQDLPKSLAEYEAHLAGLRLAKEIQVKRLHTSCDSQLVVSQVNGSFAAKDKGHGYISEVGHGGCPNFRKVQTGTDPTL